MGEIHLFQAPDGSTEVSVKFENETVWLNLFQMTRLFGRDKSVISRHIKSIFSSGELSSSVVAKNATTASDGKTYMVEYYNLDMIISVGYRVNSSQATQFRIWATKILKDYLLKGYVLNQKRLEETKLNDLEQVVAMIKKNINHFFFSSFFVGGYLG